MPARPGVRDDADDDHDVHTAAEDEDGSAEVRVFFGEVKPFAVVDRLEQLQGPDGGVVGLPHSVLWAPGSDQVDLDEPGGTALAYQATLAEGRVEDLERVLNPQRLVQVWPGLMLPGRLRALWEARFPELAAGTATGRPQ